MLVSMYLFIDSGRKNKSHRIEHNVHMEPLWNHGKSPWIKSGGSDQMSKGIMGKIHGSFQEDLVKCPKGTMGKFHGSFQEDPIKCPKESWEIPWIIPGGSDQMPQGIREKSFGSFQKDQFD